MMNLKGPGFVRIVKFVSVKVNNKDFVLMLYYSSYGFDLDMDERFHKFQEVVAHYTPKTMLEIAKGFFANYAAAYRDNHIYVNKDYQKLHNFIFYKYTHTALEHQMEKINKAIKKEKITTPEEYTKKKLEEFNKKLLLKKCNFEISDHVEVMPEEQKSRFFKQATITILNFQSNSAHYKKMTKELYMKEEFPIRKVFTKEELK